MAAQGIERSIISFGVPGPNLYPGKKLLTIALARLINEQNAAYCRASGNKMHFYAVVPLPYTAEAIREAQYAINHLGAVGIWLQTNTEGKYLGHASFRPFFEAINGWGGRQILFLHPSIPLLKINNKLVEANPTDWPTAKIEF